MKLTLEEKELILKKRKEEDDEKPKKVGYLKEDLYSYANDRDCDLHFCSDLSMDFWLATEQQKENFIKEFVEHFKRVLKKGDKFVCFIVNGKEEWYDDVNYDVECMNKEWAETYLENIKSI